MPQTRTKRGILKTSKKDDKTMFKTLITIVLLSLSVYAFSQSPFEISVCSEMNKMRENSLTRLSMLAGKDTLRFHNVGDNLFSSPTNKHEIILNKEQRVIFHFENCKYIYEIELPGGILLNCEKFNLCIMKKKAKNEFLFEFNYCGSFGATGFCNRRKKRLNK